MHVKVSINSICLSTIQRCSLLLLPKMPFPHDCRPISFVPCLSFSAVHTVRMYWHGYYLQEDIVKAENVELPGLNTGKGFQTSVMY